MRVVMIGSGRLATQLALSLYEQRAQGISIVQVWSRTSENARLLADRVGAQAAALDDIVTDADVYLLSVKDDALPVLIPQLCKGRTEGVFLHTAGSVPMSVFQGFAAHYGVFYPMQTFSKERPVSFEHIPVFIEGSDEQALHCAETLAQTVSRSVYRLTSEERRYLHLAAVFACNFANHCYALSARILDEHGLPFDVMKPLIMETAEKVQTLSPLQAQTGPAVRYDETVIEAQKALLADNPRMCDIYDIMSRSIHEELKG